MARSCDGPCRLAIVAAALAVAAPIALPVPPAKAGQPAAAPAAFADFCARHADQCAPRGAGGPAVMTAERWQDLRRVNAAVNAGIREVADASLYGESDRWTLPTGGLGDCEDIALLKRKLLIERGWSSSNLLVTVVRDRNGDGHAVLTVTTSTGDYALDNRTAAIQPTASTPYRYYTRQSRRDPRVWETVRDVRPAPAATAAPSSAMPSARPLFKWRLTSRGFR